jgi:UDP-N-acetylmuramate--alanine ligase
LVGAFERFIDSATGPVVVSADDPLLARLAGERADVHTYGFSDSAEYRIAGEEVHAESCRFTLLHNDNPLGSLTVPFGVMAAANAAGAAALALELGVDFESVATALRGYGGVARRFERRGVRAGVTFIDDYAHLPTEVAAAITAARQGDWKRVIAVFQPHRYTRTAALWKDFGDSFAEADMVVLTDVYPAGETPIPGVSGRLLVHAVLDAHPSLPLAYLPRRSDLVGVPARWARPGDVVLTLGAGDLTTLPDVWLAPSPRDADGPRDG